MERRVVTVGVAGVVLAAGAAGALLLLRGEAAPSGCRPAVDLGARFGFEPDSGEAVQVFRVVNAGTGPCDLRELPELAFAHEGKPVAVLVRSEGAADGPRRLRPRGEGTFELRWSEFGRCPSKVTVDSVTVRVADAEGPPATVPATRKGDGSAGYCRGSVTVTGVTVAVP